MQFDIVVDNWWYVLELSKVQLLARREPGDLITCEIKSAQHLPTLDA